MPTVITHAAVPLCLGLGLGTNVIPPRLLFAGIVLAMLPDADVLAFKFGVAYGNIFGHRGFTHSLLFALGGADTLRAGRPTMVQGQPDALLAVFNRVAAVAQPAGFDHHRREKASAGCGPRSDERFFAPWQVIKVAPFALSRYATPYGHEVIISELLWVWLPGMVLMGMLWWRKRAR